MSGAYSIALGDVVDVLAGFNDCSFDALVCDPPYGFSFMGKAWDYDVPSVDLWRECLRVLKPGAPLVAFGGSRTYHRLACGIEDAGFELRDQLMWLYGKGFPKSQNVEKALVAAEGRLDLSLVGSWDGYGTALKPAFEPIVLARKPLDGTMAQNVARWGVGGLAIDACRIASTDLHSVTQGGQRGDSGGFGMGLSTYVPDDAGRWPANLLLSHSESCRFTGQTRTVKNATAVKHRGVVAGTGASFGIAKAPGTPDAGYGEQECEVWECADDCPIARLDASVAPTTSTPFRANEATGAVLPMTKRTAGGYSDGGGPSRFFYCSKVSTKEREAGCEGLALRSAGEATERQTLVWTCTSCNKAEPVEGDEYKEGDREPCVSCVDGTVIASRPAGLESPRAGAGRTGGARNHHPTLKPLSLTTWLARLVMPPGGGGVVLVPFAGAGSEMIGCLKAGWSGVFGIEREAEYQAIAAARLRHWCPGSEGST